MTRKLPPQSERVETGIIQFGEDWPGVFIRGDNAMYLKQQLLILKREIERLKTGEISPKSFIQNTCLPQLTIDNFVDLLGMAVVK